jgi:N-sulfoglucosamine sulfohydrolase
MKSWLVLGLYLAVALAAVGAVRAQGERPRPNFIVFIADDMAWNDSGAYGHPRVRTPNLDRLARQGMRFDRACLTTSSCSPSRASIMTGRYPHATGAPELHMPLPVEQRMLTEPLREAGYFTGAAGKWHLGGPAKAKLDQVREGGGPGGSAGWLPLLRERPKDRPFFLWLASVDPHRPYDAGALIPPHTTQDAVVPPYLPDTEAVRKDLALYYDEIARMDAAIGAVLAEVEAQGVARDTFVLFLSDNGRPFPRCKTTLYDDGIRTPFIIRWPARVKAGSRCERVVSSVDIAPTVIELAGIKSQPSFQGRSFAPLLADPSKSTREHAFAEHNWHDYRAYERAVRSDRFTYIRNWLPELTGNPPADAVRSPTFQEMRQLRDAGKLPPEQRRIFETPRPAEELYDTRSDPHSLKNLAEDPGHKRALERMRRAMDEWRKETGDSFDREKLTPDRFDRESGEPHRFRPLGQ